MKDAKAVCHLSIRNLLIKDRPPFCILRKPGAKRQNSGEKDEADLRAESAVTSARPMWPEGKLSSGLERSDRIIEQSGRTPSIDMAEGMELKRT
jgi:hypothetical protein